MCNSGKVFYISQQKIMVTGIEVAQTRLRDKYFFQDKKCHYIYSNTYMKNTKYLESFGSTALKINKRKTKNQKM